MSGKAGPTEELQSLSQPALFRNRQDSRSRTNTTASLAHFSKRRPTFIETFDSRMAIRDPKAAGTADLVNMAISRPIQSFHNDNDVLGRRLEKEMDIEVSINLQKHDEPYVGEVSLKERLKHFTFAWYAWTMSTGGVAFVLSVVPPPTDFRVSQQSALSFSS